MVRTSLVRRRLWATGLIIGAALLAFSSLGYADDDKKPEPADQAKVDAPAKPKHVPFTVKVGGRLEPAGLQPGQSGRVIARIDPQAFAAYRVQDVNLKWEPIPVEGVTYDKAKAELTKHDYVYTDEYDDINRYWKEPFEISVPVTIGEGFKPGSTVGLAVKYVACNEDSCGDWNEVEVMLPVGGTAKPTAPVVSEPVSYGEGEVSARLADDGKSLILRFAPAFGWHFYLPPSTMGVPITITPVKADGVTWGSFKIPQGEEQNEPLEIAIPFERTTAASIQVGVKWSSCSSMGTCNDPRDEVFGVAYGDAGTQAIVRDTKEPVAAPVGKIAFPVLDTGELGDVKKQAAVADLIKEKGLAAVLGILFLIGAGLAFTPCVFPIIPLVVATITGGSEVSKGRLTTLLATYVMGLCLAFSTIGLIAALGGGSMSAAFESEVVQWAFAILFIVMAFGMLGLFELQPPQWMMKLQGGAQSKGGSIIGALLLGVLGAVLASPCTGPVIVGLIAFVATTGNAFLGFVLFFVLGLGMGVVFFAFGSLNFALRPGPWMVWVRYVFGMLLFGGAMYYIGSGRLARGWSIAVAVACALAFVILAVKAQAAQHTAEKARGRKWLLIMLAAFALIAGLSLLGLLPFSFKSVPVDMLIAGGFIAVASAAALYWHLHGKEGEQKGVAGKRAVIVTGMYAIALGLAAYITWPPPEKVKWTYVASRAELIAEVNKGKAAGKPVIVDIWADT